MRERVFKVFIKLASITDPDHLEQFLAGEQSDTPQETIQVLDIVLRESPSNNYTAIGRSFFSMKMGQRTDVGDGLECWRGYYQSLRPTQMGMSLNIDVVAASLYEAISVIDYVQKLLNLRDPSRRLSDSNRIKVKKAVKGLHVELTHRKEEKRNKITGITTQPIEQLMFTVDEGGRRMSVAQYFHDKYDVKLRYGHWPALQAGSDSKPAYFPMEVCKIVEGQRYSKRLNVKQVTNILRASCQRPKQREDNIKTMPLHNDYKNDVFAKEFGIEVIPQLVVIQTARVLPAPMLKYRDTGRDVRLQPRMGQWNMINAKMVNGGTINHWMCINFSFLNEEPAGYFFHGLVSMCNSKGMSINPTPLLPMHSTRSDQIERTLIEAHTQSASKIASSGQQGNLQLLIIILPDLTGSYGKIKRICETELKQWALSRRMPIVSEKPTIIFGADVTHPSPGEDSSPSIAAVVASMDWPEISKYRGLVSAQHPHQELIQDLYSLVEDPQKGTSHAGMIRELLISFRKSNGFKPHRIIFYRLVLLWKRGTVVDSMICHPSEFDFYLCSHAGIQGTSRPTHYHVLWDENNFNSDTMPILTNNLCYTYARCTRSASVVPPTYYAHLAAFRTRHYIEGEVSDSGTGASATSKQQAEVRSLPKIKDNVKDVMFYC
ncbi:hypothetical protein IFM89_034695 [Coptis chinensis]|uniref:Uncharacterized protein n=1 Tax=Coptis chinensis TaxID=261450 RepID=A0A835LJG0_9MAGN|nr:hypothetical protein IFM89_034695 [Coptis chinensis]